MDKELINQLTSEYTEHTTIIELLLTNLQKIPADTDTERTIHLEKAQEYLNQLYNIKASDVLVDVQVLINEYRYEFNISDPREVVCVCDGSGFVQ